MKSLLTATVIVCATATSVAQQPTTQTTRNWWQSRTRAERVAYTNGFVAGMGYFSRFIRVGVPSQTCQAQVSAAVEQFRQVAWEVNGEQIAEGLDHFYTDYRNQMVDVISAAGIVFLELTGAAEQEVKRATEQARRAAAGGPG